MFCHVYKKNVLVQDCEKCLSLRLCDPVCIIRGFVWGKPDNDEPSWIHSHEKALDSDEDVSMYFDKNWEGNTHLIEAKKTNNKTRIGYIPPEIRWQVWERDNFTCQICGKRQYLTIDHIYPKSKGGRTTIDNLQTLCRFCNSQKGNKVEKQINDSI